MLTIQERSISLTDEQRCSCQKPRVVPAGDGRFCVCYEQYGDGKNEAAVAFVDREGRMNAPAKPISGPGKAFMADLHGMAGEIYAVWSEWNGDRWELCLAEVSHPAGGRLVLASGRGVFHGGMADDGDRLLVYWDELDETGGNSVKCLFLERRESGGLTAGEMLPAEGVVNGDDTVETVCASDVCQYYRPVMAFTETGHLIAAYDYFDGKAYVTALKLRKNGRWTEEILLSGGDGWASDVSMIVSGDTVTVSWQEILPKGMVNYWYSDIRLLPEGGVELDTHQLVNAQIWYAWNRLLLASGSLGGEGKKEEKQALLTGHNMSQFYIRLREAGGRFRPAVLATDEIGLEGALYGDGLIDGTDLFLFYQHSNCNGHQERMSSIRFLRIPLSEMEDMDDSSLEVRRDEFYMAIPTRKTMDKIPEERQKAWLEKNGCGDYHIWFGDIHGQSNLSDGLGHVDQYYHYASAVTGQDFTALTDHDVFPDVITEAEWEYEKTMADAFHRPGSLATMISYEWTANEFRYDFGHKNVYYPDRSGRLYHASDREGMTPDRLYRNLREAGAMAFPHHPAATWGVVSAATDWDFHDLQVERNVEIFSRHAPFEKRGTASVYAKNKQRLDGKYVQDALARGYHLGFVAGSDSHQLEHGMEGGILGAYMETLDREHLFHALYHRAVYATTGAWMLLSLKVNGQMMGSELELDQGGERLTIQISVLAPSAVRETVLVRNNEDIRTVAGRGEACDFTVDDCMTNGETEVWYYLRVTLENEHMGWTSPIWVRRRTE